MRNKNAHRLLCLLLSTIMLFGIFPVSSIASKTTSAQDAARSGQLTLDNILGTDWFGVGNYCHIEIDETQNGNALGWTLLNVPGSFSDRDVRFSNDPTAVIDWSGATDLLIDLDASAITSVIKVRIAFEENAVGRESYQLTEGCTVYLITDAGESEATVQSGGYVSLPIGFKGKLRLPLNTDTFHRYYHENGNNVLDTSKVVQFQLSVAGDSNFIGNTFTMDNFSIRGSFGTKVVWDLENIHKRNGYVAIEKGSTSALTSYIQNMNLAGYVGENLIGNVRNWQLEAYQNNRGIIEQIAIANAKTLALDHLLGTDYFGVDGYHTIDIVETDSGKALGWTLKSVPGSYSDRDIKYANDPAAVTDWTGATDLIIDLDASSIKSTVRVRIAFEENAVGRESYQLTDGAAVYLITDAGEIQSTVQGGYVSLPIGFQGKLRLPLNSNTFHRYWQENGNGALDTSKVVQFQLSVAGDEKFIGNTFTMDNFTVLGSFGTKVVWDLENVMKRGSGGDVGNGNIQKWYGEFVGKLLNGMAYSYKATAEKDLVSAANEIIADLAMAQGDDGYLGVFIGNARYSLAFDNWDLWNQYHCISGLLEWYKLTKNPTALDVAKKALDCIYNTFKDRSYIVAGGFETNRGIAHGYAQMYQATGEQKYLNEAIRIIEEDCKHNGNGWYPYAIAGKDFVNSNCQRWEVLHIVMTLGILYEETGNKEYYEVMGTVWESVLKTDIHNAGTFTTNEGAHGNPYDDGVVETCCTIAWAAFTNEYYKYNQSVRLADELERSYLNGILASLLDNDKYCTYNTPMNGFVGSAFGYDGRKVSSQQDIAFQYNTASPDMNCCQANYARGIGQISEWALMTGENALYLNYYGTSSIQTLIDGKAITLTQETEYPLNGAVKLTVSGLEEDTAFTLKLRIPTWSYGSKVTYDGIVSVAQSGEYFEITKTWKNGDTVLIDIAFSFTYWSGEQAQNGKTSVFYGPILLALDSYYAPTNDQNTVFTRDAIENAVIKTDTESDTFLCAYIKIDDTTEVRLVDFASVGKYNGNQEPSTYYSWLIIEDAPAVKDGITWQNTDKYKIAFDAYVEYDSALAYAGDTVIFTVNTPAGKVIDKIMCDGVDLAKNNSIYSFTMPAKDITVSVSFKDAIDVKFEGHQMGTDGSSIRFIGSVSNLDYESVDLQITVTGDATKSFTHPTTKVFRVLKGSIAGVNQTVAATKSSGVTGENITVIDADYLFGYAITGITAGTYTFTIVPIATTDTGEVLQGETATITVTI